jgi:predicted site-specific integrase-resolvase
MSAILKPRLIRLETWASEVYGSDAPSLRTLRNWAKDGRIYPAPQKQGRSYYVQADAQYIDPTASTGKLLEAIRESTTPKRR